MSQPESPLSHITEGRPKYHKPTTVHQLHGLFIEGNHRDPSLSHAQVSIRARVRPSHRFVSDGRETTRPNGHRAMARRGRVVRLLSNSLSIHPRSHHNPQTRARAHTPKHLPTHLPTHPRRPCFRAFLDGGPHFRAFFDGGAAPSNLCAVLICTCVDQARALKHSCIDLHLLYQ